MASAADLQDGMQQEFDISQTVSTNRLNRFPLENGLRLLTNYQPGTRLVAIEIIVRTGCIYEEARLGSGLAHLVEHMLFKGTEQWPLPGDIQSRINSLGADINGYTSHEITGYTVSAPAENFHEILAILSDMLRRPLFDEVELNKEKKVIFNEIRLTRDDPDRYLGRLFWEAAYSGSVYALPVIGREQLFAELQRNDVLDFYRRWYIPNNTVISIAGDVDTQTMRSAVDELLGDWPMRPYPPPGLPPVAELPISRNIGEPFDTELMHMCIGMPSVPLWHRDAPVLDVIAVLLGQGESSRLYRRLVQDESLVYSVQAGNYTPSFRGVFSVNMKLAPDRQAQAIAAMWEECARLAREPVSERDVRKAVNQFLSDYVFSHETVQSSASIAAHDEVYAGDPDFSHRYIDAVAQVSGADILRCATEYLRPDRAVTVYLHPPSVVPSAPVTNSGPVASRLVALPNGLRLIIREDHRQPVFACQAVCNGGVRFETEQTNGLFYLLSQMLPQGTSVRSSEEIAADLEQMGASLQPFSGFNSFGLSLEALSRDWRSSLDIFFDILQNASFPETELETERNVAVQAVKLEKEDVFRDTMTQLRNGLFPNHPFRFSSLGSVPVLERISAEQLRSAFARYCVPANMVISVSGDIVSAEIEQLVREKLGSRPSGTTAVITDIPGPLTAAPILLEHRREKKQAVVMIGFRAVPVSDPERYDLEVLSRVLTGPGSILYQQIREDAGLAYTVGGSLVPGIDTGFFFIYAATAQESAQRVYELMGDSISRLQSERLSGDMVESAKRNLIGEFRSSIQKNQAVVFQSSLDELYGLGYNRYTDFEEQINRVTPETLSQVIRKFITPQAAVGVITRNKP